MLKIHKRVLAEIDLVDIWIYSSSQWGPDQADIYLDQLEHALLNLAERPLIGVACDDIHCGYRRFSVGKHQIYYLIEGEILHIIRVLGDDMLADLWLE